MSTDMHAVIMEAWAAKNRGEIEDTNQYIRERLPDPEREMFDRTLAEIEESVRSIAGALAIAYASDEHDSFPPGKPIDTAGGAMRLAELTDEELDELVLRVASRLADMMQKARARKQEAAEALRGRSLS